MPTRRDTHHHRSQHFTFPTILIALISLQTVGCDKIQIPEVGQAAAPAAPPAPTIDHTAPLATAPVGTASTPMPTAKPDPKQVVTTFLKRAKESGLTDQDMLDITSEEGLEGLNEITELKLAAASLTDVGVVRLVKFPKLAKLDLSNGLATASGIITVVRGLPELTTLGLNSTNTNDLVLAEVANHPGITELYVGKTSITDVGLNELSKLKNLEVLDVSNTSITGEGFERFKGHHKLRTVLAQRSQLQNGGLQFLSNCPIEVLEIDMAKVSDPGMIFVGRMKKLKRLSMGLSSISDVGIRKLGEMKDLEWVSVRDDPVSKLFVKKLMACKKLKYVCIAGTQISPADCSALQKSIPGCEIER